MATQTYPVTADGFAFEVLIGLNWTDTAHLVAAGLPVPAPVLARALVDTGSNVTCVATSIIRSLGLKHLGRQTTQTVSGSLLVRLFEVSLSIPAAQPGSGPLLVLPQLV